MFDAKMRSPMGGATADGDALPSGPGQIPLERLEAQICELAGHLAAATCRFLVLLADFDARRGWASWEMSSCAGWLSWKCQLSSGTAREHVRVARCRFPGCESRRVDLHHIQYWSHGGRTELANLVSLCKYHHLLVHDRGYLIAAARDGTFAFYRPDGTAVPASPPLPQPGGTIEDWHDAAITPETIIPPWYGERLDLDYAIWACLANARTMAERRAGRDQAAESGDRVQVFEPEGWADRIRQYYAEHAA